MAVVDVRIEDRLIHGQVVSYWIPFNKVNKILIVDEKIAKDQFRKTALKFGTPKNVKLSFYDPKTCADKLNRNLDKGSNVMLLANNPNSLLELYKEGYKFEKITVGNISPEKGAEYHIKKTLYLTKEDLESFKELINYGIEIIVQIVPDDTPEKLENLIRGL